MPDATEPIRRQRLVEINAEPGSREALEAQHGQVWNTDELGRGGRRVIVGDIAADFDFVELGFEFYISAKSFGFYDWTVNTQRC